MKRLCYLLFALFLAACGEKEAASQPELIAHAGGEIDGYIYTNSLEAIEKSIAEGYKYIEIDFSITADSVVVAAHDWAGYNKDTGFAHKGDTAPVLADFKARRLHGVYTPLTAAEVNEIFEKDTSLVLVTDKISSPEILARKFPALKERMVVEAFSYSDYVALLDAGYMRVLYSVLACDLSASIKKHLLFHIFNSGPKIEWLAVHTSAFDYPLFKFMLAVADFNMALFTINDMRDIPQKYADRVKMIYTENIKP